MLSPTSLELLQYYPAANRAGTANNLQAPSANTDNVDQVLARVDQNLGNKIRLNVRYNWHDSFNAQHRQRRHSRHGGHAAAREQELAVLLHAHAAAEPAQRFPDRLSPHRLRYREPVLCERPGGRRDRRSAFPGSTGDTAFNNPGLPSINVSNFSGLSAAGTNWFQFDTTFQVSNVLAYNRGSHNVRTGFDLRRLATGRRAANDPRGRFDFTGDISGYSVADFMLGLPRTVIPPTDQLQGHVGGWRNGFFVNDTWQASRNLTLNLGLRYELNTPVQTYAGLATMLAEDLDDHHPEHVPERGLQVPRSELQGHRPLVLAPRIASARRRSLRAGFGIYYNPNQMNSFTFLTNNPPLAAVTTYTSDPANPDAVVLEPHWSRGTGGPPRRHLADARSAQRAEGSVELRRAARARAEHGARLSVRRLEHQSSGSQLLQQHAARPVPAPLIRGGRARSSAAGA